MRSPSRLVFLLIFALFGCAFTDPEMTVITNETSEDVKQSEGNKLLGVVTNGEGKVEGPSFGISGSATVGIEGEATGMEDKKLDETPHDLLGSIEDKKPHGEEDADEAKRKLAMSDVGEGHVQVNGTTNADLEENESSMVYQEPTEEEKMPGKEVSAAEVIEGNTTDGGVVMEADKTEAHAQPNDEENVTKSQEETSDGPLGPKDDQKSHADEGSDVEGVERDAAVLEANSEGGEGSVHIDGPIEEKKLRDDEGSDEKEIERKAAEEKAVIEEGEATIIVDVSPIPTIEDQKAFEAASESVGSLTLTSAVLWATVSLLPIIH